MAHNSVRKQWLGSIPEACDICEEPLIEEFIDGRLRQHGSWAIMCLACHAASGVGLGIGRGQHYQRVAEGDEAKWIKQEDSL